MAVVVNGPTPRTDVLDETSGSDVLWSRKGPEYRALARLIECQAATALEQQSREIARLERELVGALELLRAVKCSNCGDQGWTAYQVEAGVCAQEQCQWCFERHQLTAALSPVDAGAGGSNLFLNCGDCGLDQGWANGACPRCGRSP